MISMLEFGGRYALVYASPNTNQIMNGVRVGKRKMFTGKARALICFIFPLVCLLSSQVYAAAWTTNVDERNGLPGLSKNGVTSVQICTL